MGNLADEKLDLEILAHHRDLLAPRPSSALLFSIFIIRLEILS